MNKIQFFEKTRSFFVPPYLPKLVFLVISLLAVLLPQMVESGYILHIITMVAFYAYLGIAWNILGGFSGQMSLGHGVILGVGAYKYAIL